MIAAAIAVAMARGWSYMCGRRRHHRSGALTLLACDAVALGAGATITLAFVLAGHMPGLLAC